MCLLLVVVFAAYYVLTHGLAVSGLLLNSNLALA
jgi:hypothetical protein